MLGVTALAGLKLAWMSPWQREGQVMAIGSVAGLAVLLFLRLKGLV